MIVKEQLLEELMREHVAAEFVGQCGRFRALLEELKKIANMHISVLLVGETGTGKNLCAEFIHHYGARKHGPYIHYNCGICPDGLLESQLFGHCKGAFTGAHQDHCGLVEEADTGTLVLDEINSLSLASQVKLNQFFESRFFRRVGENQLRQADVRIVAATNIDLESEVQAGRFREDLYYRLAEYQIRVPPLRERREDIGLLVAFFAEKYASLSPIGPLQFSPKAISRLCELDWPGNVRELENFIKRCMIDAQNPVIDEACVPIQRINARDDTTRFLDQFTWKDAKRQVIADFECRYLQRLLHQHHGVVSQCARHAGLLPSDFWKLMRKYHLRAENFKGDLVQHPCV